MSQLLPPMTLFFNLSVVTALIKFFAFFVCLFVFNFKLTVYGFIKLGLKYWISFDQILNYLSFSNNKSS